MEIGHIREFVTLAETKSFYETAELLFTTQSTISKHLKLVEKELGHPLLNRNSRRVELNEYGRLFLPHAQKILQIQYEYTTDFYNKSKRLLSTLTIGSIPFMAQYNITDIIVRFKKENTNFKLNVIEAESNDLKTMLLKGKCELAFIRETDKPDAKFVKIPYFTDNLVALLPANHQKAYEASINLSDLSNEDFLFIQVKTYIYNLCINACNDAGFQPNIVFTSHRLENIIDLVAMGMGISLLMKEQTKHLPADKVTAISISPTVTSQLFLTYKKDSPLSPAALHFIRCTDYL